MLESLWFKDPDDENEKTDIIFLIIYPKGLRASNATMSSQSSANKHKTSPDNRSLNNPKASSVDDTEDENEDGAHDTITSLAGAKMLQRYRRAISGSTKGSATSLSQVHIIIRDSH